MNTVSRIREVHIETVWEKGKAVQYLMVLMIATELRAYGLELISR
jgi:hypothetical protein